MGGRQKLRRAGELLLLVLILALSVLIFLFRDRIGQVILTGKDAGDAKDHLDKVLSSLHLKVSMGK